ncbi:MAG: FG-GAP-like repeat-containing protein [Nitrospirales bacterium]
MSKLCRWVLMLGFVCWCVGYANPGQAQNLTYTPIPSIPVGRSPQAIVVGDWNKDGLWDLATVNGTSDDVSVLIGNGNGTFRSAVSFGVGKIPLALVAADMDRDGILDLVVALSGVDRVVVLKGDGQGLFQKFASQSTGKGTTFLAVRDVDGDGWSDVIAVNSGRFGYYPPFNLSVLLNDGQGGLQSPVTYENDGRDGMFPTGVLVEDLTGDGLPDLVVTWSQPSWRSANGLISILRNTGKGAFAFHKDLHPGFTLSAIQSADFDHNGFGDLVVTSLYADTVRLVLQKEQGVFHHLDPIKVGFAPVGLAIQDFNQDGEWDLAVVNRDSNSLSLLVGNGKGAFRSAGHFGVGATPSAVIVADFDQDHSPDFATASTNSDGVSVLLSGSGAIPLPSLSTDALVFERDGAEIESSHPSSPQMVRISNIGLGGLRVAEMIIAGKAAEAFSILENTCVDVTMKTGESCTVQVVFTAKSSGTHSATLTIQDNANGSPRRVALKGLIKG